MKQHNFFTGAFLLIALSALFTQCCKDKPEDPNDNVPGLPPATQSGRNTFGCLVNGQAWTPAGSDGTANLSIDYDPGINNGVVGIAAYRLLSQTSQTSLGVGIIDSLNLLQPPFTRTLSRTSIYRAGYSDVFRCVLYSHYNTVWSSGSITILKHDRTARIIAGTFEATLYENNGCDTVRITNGRFDMKF